MTDTVAGTGVLLGLACGDALGRPVEFKTSNQIEREHGRLTAMVGNGSHRQPAGTVTDDTALALCLARSLVDTGEFDPEDIGVRFVAWYRSDPFDIGNTTRESLEALADGIPWQDAGKAVHERRGEGRNAGNGSVMRCAPLALAYRGDRDSLVAASRQSSAITHYDPRCRAGCAVLNLTLVNCLEGHKAPLAAALDALGDDVPDELADTLAPVAAGDSVEPLATNGYVVTTLQTALACALSADSAEEAIVRAVNLGGDADTIGAVAGAVAGARFGADALPAEWCESLRPVSEGEIVSTAGELSTTEYPSVDPMF